MAQSSVSLKLLIDTTKVKRVLFAEADKNCVDFLFQILSLPVATIIRLLEGEGMQGSLPNLFRSLENLNDTYIQNNQTKDTFLNPVLRLSTTSIPLPALTYAHTPTAKNFYGCDNCHGNYGYSSCNNIYVSDGQSAICPRCNNRMTMAMSYVEPPAVKGQVSGGGGLVKGVVTYMVMDDLVVQPMSTISSLTLLNKFKVKDVGALEEKMVDFGINEAVKLLKASLDSNTVLTDVFC